MHTAGFILIGLCGGVVISFFCDPVGTFYWIKRHKEMREQLEEAEAKLQAAELDCRDCRQKSEADSMIAEEAKDLYLTWFKSKRGLVHTNVVEGSVIRGIERLGALIIAVKGIREVSTAFAEAKNAGLPDFTRKLERVHENGEVFLREIVP